MREKASVVVDAHIEVVVRTRANDEISKIYLVAQACDEQLYIVLKTAVCKRKSIRFAVEASAGICGSRAGDFKFDGEVCTWPHVRPNASIKPTREAGSA
ncbi:hypothetical protein [Xanthomonas sp. LMG 12462]|uniref:hypothetical protein n=1 Tax=Xanthomonas sp. LMG 12462 TaxID=1591134 RepID=UPI001264B478|nr:hypothetical protein [Xanthomonas sp. LMG 12462]